MNTSSYEYISWKKIFFLLWRGDEHNNKVDFRESGWGGMDCTDLAKDRDRWRALVSAVMNLRVPYNVRKFSAI